MTLPLNATIVIPQGVTWSTRWRVSDPATGNPRDLTGWTARCQIRGDVDSSTLLYTFTDVTCDEDGWVTLAVAPVISSAWTWRRGVYDVELEDTTGRVARISQGDVRVSPEVTR